MKVSTMVQSNRSSDNSKKVLQFFCGPHHGGEHVMLVGYNLLRQINYNTLGEMYYKSEAQSREGTRYDFKLGVKSDYFSNFKFEYHSRKIFKSCFDIGP